MRAVQADVNRQREQYSQTDDAEDVARIELMVRELAVQNRSFDTDKIAEGLEGIWCLCTVVAEHTPDKPIGSLRSGIH